MKSRDLNLIMNLRNDCRKNLSIIGREIRVPVTTLFSTLKDMEKSIIHKYACLVDLQSLGYGVRISLAIKCNNKNKSNKEKIKDFLMNNNNIDSVFRTNNGFDFLVEAVFRNMGELENFLEQLDDLKPKKKRLHYIVEEYKKEDFLTRKEHLDLFD